VHIRDGFHSYGRRILYNCSMSLEDDIRRQALELGFDAVGITDASAIDADQAEHLSAWLDAGFAAQMQYMHRNFNKRTDPSQLLKGAQSVIVVALNYKPRETGANSADATGAVANYALYEDYHPFMKKRLRKLAEFIASAPGEDIRFKTCVDSAPLPERALAVRAGLGFLGRNHMLINPALGPEIFLGEILTTIKLNHSNKTPPVIPSEKTPLVIPSEAEESVQTTSRSDSSSQSQLLLEPSKPDKPIPDQCSHCSKCIDACPTGALRSDGSFDASRCVSYLTIEHKGHITPQQAAGIGDRLFGCDECVKVCPYRENAPAAANDRIMFYPERAEMDLDHILDLNAEAFQREFADSPIKRLGSDRLKRNARICAENAPKRTGRSR